jgi:ABC-type thiamine transport system ATPase subunit
MINFQDPINRNLDAQEIPLELFESLELLPIPSIKVSNEEKLSYIKFMLSEISVEKKLFQKCGGGDIQVAMARSLVRIKSIKLI